MQELKIKYKGQDAVVEYDDELTIGDLEPIINATMIINYENLGASRVYFEEYIQQVLVKAIKKAPFNFSSPNDVRKSLTAKLWAELADKIVVEHYSMKVFLALRVNLLLGRPSAGKVSLGETGSTSKS